MGLDGVELLIALEERFNISIPDADAEKLETPRKVIDYIANRLAAANSDKTCFSQQGFYLTRRVLTDNLCLPLRSIRPATTLESIIPKEKRKNLQQIVKEQLGVRLTLRRPTWLVRIIFYSSSILFLIASVILSPYGHFLFESLLIAACFAFLFLLVTSPFAIHTDLTVGVIAKLTVPHIAEKYVQEQQSINWSRNQIAEVTRSIIMEQLGLDHFSDDDHFVKDLGVD